MHFNRRLEPTAPIPIIVPAKLSEIELLLIICALLFLTLLLLGIGMAYYCLKRRNIKIVRKKKTFSSAPSEITKLSHSTLFDPIRIPRATAQSSSSETIPSDYPSSESDERRTIVSETSTIRNDHFRFENSAFIPEPYPLDIEREDSVASVPLPVAHKPNITTANFTETMVTTENITEEDVINTTHRRTTAKLYKKLPTTTHPPSIPDNDNRSDIETEASIPTRPYVKHDPNYTSRTVDDTFVDTENVVDVDELTTRHKRLVPAAPPKITLRKIDDLYVTNITETDTTEHTVVNRSMLPVITPPTATDVKRVAPPPPLRSVTNITESAASYDHRRHEATHEKVVLPSAPTDSDPLAVPRLAKEPTAPVNTPREREVIHVLDNPPPVVEGVDELTNTDKRKWVTLITTDEVFRSMVIECTSFEELVRITRDVRYASLFEERKWEIIVRVLYYTSTGLVVPPSTSRATDTATTTTTHMTSTQVYKVKASPPPPGTAASQAKSSQPTHVR